MSVEYLLVNTFPKIVTCWSTAIGVGVTNHTILIPAQSEYVISLNGAGYAPDKPGRGGRGNFDHAPDGCRLYTCGCRQRGC